jgi:general secretion pathway protein H
MPTSAAGSEVPAKRGRRRPRFRAPAGAGAPVPGGEGGFTLVELMVVLLVLALASAAVVLAMPDPRGRVRDEAERFAARVRAAHDLALVDGAPVSLWVAPGGYGFDQRRGGAWMPLADKPFRVERWQPGTRVQPAGGRERVTFDATGLADRPLDLALARDGGAARVFVGVDGSVRVPR